MKTVGYDLLYVDPDEYEKLWVGVVEIWPHAKLEDASDYIHDRRFSVDFSGTDEPTEEEWWRWLLTEGAHFCSLNFTMATKMPERVDDVKAFIAKMKKEGVLQSAPQAELKEAE